MGRVGVVPKEKYLGIDDVQSAAEHGRRCEVVEREMVIWALVRGWDVVGLPEKAAVGLPRQIRIMHQLNVLRKESGKGWHGEAMATTHVRAGALVGPCRQALRHGNGSGVPQIQSCSRHQRPVDVCRGGGHFCMASGTRLRRRRQLPGVRVRRAYLPVANPVRRLRGPLGRRRSAFDTQRDRTSFDRPPPMPRHAPPHPPPARPLRQAGTAGGTTARPYMTQKSKRDCHRKIETDWKGSEDFLFGGPGALVRLSGRRNIPRVAFCFGPAGDRARAVPWSGRKAGPGSPEGQPQGPLRRGEIVRAQGTGRPSRAHAQLCPLRLDGERDACPTAHDCSLLPP